MPKTILIIEDEQPLIRILRQALASQDCDLIGAASGDTGLNIALKLKPDLILLDIMLPKLNGIELLKKLREDTWGKTVPVLVLSNFNDYEKITQARKLGVIDYIIKSDVSTKELADKIAQILT